MDRPGFGRGGFFLPACFAWRDLLWRSPLSRVGLSCCASSQVKKPTRLAPSGFNPRRQAGSHASGLRPARSACPCAASRRATDSGGHVQPSTYRTARLMRSRGFRGISSVASSLGIPRPLDRAGRCGRPGLPRPPETVWHHLQGIRALQVEKRQRPCRPR